MSKIKVMVVDDQALMRDGLNTILSLQEDMEVVALARDGIEALEFAEVLDIDVVLMDVRMPNMDGVTCTQKIMSLKKGIQVLMLTTFDDDDYIINALSYGASGYLLKDTDGEGLVTAIRSVVKGKLMLPSLIANKIATSIRGLKEGQKKNKEILTSFTNREVDIIKLLVKGLSNREMADTLFLTEGTIKNYLTGIYAKIETNDRGKAILILQDLSF